VFEGSQGILLDQNHGFYPHVTRGNVTSKNAMEIIKRIGDKEAYNTKIYYVSRTYATRHGAGNLEHEGDFESLSVGRDETNIYNDWQENIRIGLLDFRLMKYAIGCDLAYSFDANSRNLIITHLNEVKDIHSIPIINESGMCQNFTCHELASELNLTGYGFSSSKNFEELILV